MEHSKNLVAIDRLLALNLIPYGTSTYLFVVMGHESVPL